MTERHHPLAKCEECPLFGFGKYVASEGPVDAKLAIVGEGPGVQEARSGSPFQGPAGKLLNAILAHHNIDRDEILLTNAAACRAPDGSTPPKSAISACRPRVISELENCETVVALGNSATESVLGKTGVTKLRSGPGKYGNYLPGVRIIPTIHPAAALRQADQFPNIVTDIGKVNIDVRVWDPPEYIVADDELDALALLDQLDQRIRENDEHEKVIVVDIEVNIEKDTSFDIPTKYGMLCVGLGYAPGRVLVLAEGVMGSESVRSRLGDLLRSYKVVCQNGKFDLKGLWPLIGGIELWFDTMLASYVFDERPGVHGLKYMAVEFLGAPQYDEEISRYVTGGSGYGAIPRDLLYKYNAYDVSCTYDLYRMFSAKFRDDPSGAELRSVHDHLVCASNELMYVELNGIAVDRTYLDTLNVELIDKLHGIEGRIDSIIGNVNYDKKGGINPRSPMQVKAYLHDKGIQVASTDVDTLEFILGRSKLPKDEDEVRSFCTTLLEHRHESKLHSTYVKGIAKRMYAGRVYPNFLLHGTTTGRLSCRNPNLQNIPRESSMRRMFVPAKEGNLFLQTDYSQAELRVLSFLAKDIYFRDIFNDGTIDIFDDLTPKLYKGIQKGDVDAAAWKELRIRIKAFVYGLNYGREAGSIAKEFDFPMSEAVEIKNNFFRTIPEVVAFQERTKEMVLNGQDLVTPWGRHRRYALITEENKRDVMNEALAFLPQSTSSDMCLQAMYWTRKEIRGLGFIRNIVHDSLLIEGPEENMEELTEIVERNMIKSAESIVGDYVKFAVESKIGKDWSAV